MVVSRESSAAKTKTVNVFNLGNGDCAMRHVNSIMNFSEEIMSTNAKNNRNLNQPENTPV